MSMSFYNYNITKNAVSYHFAKLDELQLITKDIAQHINLMLNTPTMEIVNSLNKEPNTNVDRIHSYSLGDIQFPLSETERTIANLFRSKVYNYVNQKGEQLNIIYRSYEGTGRYVFIREQKGFHGPTALNEREHCEKYRLCTRNFENDLNSGLLFSKIYQDSVTGRMTFSLSSPIYFEGELVGDIILDYFLDTYGIISFKNDGLNGVNYLILRNFTSSLISLPFTKIWKKQLDTQTLLVFEYSMSSIFFNLLSILPFIFVLVYFVMRDNLKRQKLLLEKTKEAYFDVLTGVYNRKIYSSKLFTSIVKNQDVAIVMVDGNDIKIINDTYGHHIGDEAIQVIAHTMKRVFRKSDYIIRNGGDEFVVVLVGCNNARALEIVSIFKNEVQNLKLSIADINLSVSVGIYIKKTYVSMKSALIEADNLMYQDKINTKSITSD